jgi:hypothetical protein
LITSAKVTSTYLGIVVAKTNRPEVMTCHEIIPHRESRYTSMSYWVTAKRFSSFLFFVDSVWLSKIAPHKMSSKTGKLFCASLQTAIQADTADVFSEPDIETCFQNLLLNIS